MAGRGSGIHLGHHPSTGQRVVIKTFDPTVTTDAEQRLRFRRDQHQIQTCPRRSTQGLKVMDYGKHLFELKKTKAAQRKKQKQIQVKEIKFRPGTDIGDYNVKLRNLVRFLTDGDKVKVTLRFRGREMAHIEEGRRVIEEILEQLARTEDLGAEIGDVEDDDRQRGHGARGY